MREKIRINYTVLTVSNLASILLVEGYLFSILQFVFLVPGEYFNESFQASRLRSSRESGSNDGFNSRFDFIGSFKSVRARSDVPSIFEGFQVIRSSRVVLATLKCFRK